MRQLLLLTTSFPFGNGEDFLTEELRRASGFDGVVICACHAGQEAEQTKPDPDADYTEDEDDDFELPDEDDVTDGEEIDSEDEPEDDNEEQM